MLLLLGGASRAGKTMLAQRLLKERNVPFFSLDMLAMGLVNGMPEFGFDPDASGMERGEKLWSVVRAIGVNILETGVETYCIEGDTLLPGRVQELVHAFPGMVRACFVGYAEIAPDRKLKFIRECGGQTNDWVADSPDEYVLDLIDEMREFSRSLRAECQRVGLPYFDTGVNFQPTLNRAYEYLTEGSGA